jgi:hypothetical protein
MSLMFKPVYIEVKGDFLDFFSFMYDIQHDSSAAPQRMEEDAGIEPRTVAATALAVISSNHSARSHPLLG